MPPEDVHTSNRPTQYGLPDEQPPVTGPYTEYQLDPNVEAEDTETEPASIDPSATYRFGDKSITGQQLIEAMLSPKPAAANGNGTEPATSAPASTEADRFDRLAEQIATLAQAIAAGNAPAAPASAVSEWANQYRPDASGVIPDVGAEDVVGGILAVQQDFGSQFQTLAQSIEQLQQQLAGIPEQASAAAQQQIAETQQQATVQQARQSAYDAAVTTYLTAQAQAQGVENPEDLRPAYEKLFAVIGNDASLVIETDPAQLQIKALALLNQHGDMIKPAKPKADSQSLYRASQQRIGQLRNPQQRNRGRTTAGLPLTPPPANRRPDAPTAVWSDEELWSATRAGLNARQRV